MAIIKNPTTVMAGENKLNKLLTKAITSATAEDMQGVTKIEPYTFANCNSLTSLSLPSTLTNIGSYAFESCTGLTSLDIPASTTTIGTNAFINCSGLNYITVGSGNTAYSGTGNCLIRKSDKVLIKGSNNSIIPSDGTVTGVGFGAFRGHTLLTSITIPNDITLMSEYAFSASGLTNVTFEANSQLTQIENYAFGSCMNLTTIDLPSTVTYMGTVFYESGLTSIVVPDGVTTLNGQTFRECRSLKTAVLGTGLTRIKSLVFYSCNSLETVVIKNTSSVITLDDNTSFNVSSQILSFYIPYALIDTYKTATNWINYASKFKPAVATVADLSSIDTNSYTQAWVYATSKIYIYDGTQWSEV